MQQTSLLSFFFNLFIYLWLHWQVFVAARGLSLVAASGGYSSLWCAGFSLRWLLLLQSTGSRCVGFSSCGSEALEHRLSSCGAWAQLFCGMWDLPRPGLEPVSPALAGGFLTTETPEKSPLLSYFKTYHSTYFSNHHPDQSAVINREERPYSSKKTDSLEAQMMVSILSNKVFLN